MYTIYSNFYNSVLKISSIIELEKNSLISMDLICRLRLFFFNDFL